MGNAMRALAVAALAVLCGCTDRAGQAEKQYAIVKKVGGADDICAQGRVVAAAYLQEQDSERYATRKVETAIECETALTRESLGIYRMPDGTDQKIEPDNMEPTPSATDIDANLGVP